MIEVRREREALRRMHSVFNVAPREGGMEEEGGGSTTSARDQRLGHYYSHTTSLLWSEASVRCEELHWVVIAASFCCDAALDVWAPIQ